jgi:ATP-dependent RNA helicase RhlE
MSFEGLGLATHLLSAVQEQGYTTPTPIQKLVIPPILNGEDVIAAAQTGTGKTAGFTLPLLQRLSERTVKAKQVRALILTPTRELAAQVHESVEAYGAHLPFKASVVFGGVNINMQIKRLRHHQDIIIATPGRLLDLVEQGILDLSHVEVLVLDEADRMLDMGFIRDLTRILKLLPKKRQSLLFSATFSKEIKALAQAQMHKPVQLGVAKQNATADGVRQQVHPVDKSRKRELLSFMIGSKNWRQVLVFTRTKHGANRLAQQLERDGLKTAAIHGNKSQGARTRALAAFKEGKLRVLVATDIAARGLDIEKLPYVVNFDLPNIAEDYVHRIGRTGRASCKGLAVSLVSVDELEYLRDIEKLLRCKLEQVVFPGFEPDPSIKPAAPAKKKSQGGGRRKSSEFSPGGSRRSSSSAKKSQHGSSRRRSSESSSGDSRKSSGSAKKHSRYKSSESSSGDSRKSSGSAKKHTRYKSSESSSGDSRKSSGSAKKHSRYKSSESSSGDSRKSSGSANKHSRYKSSESSSGDSRKSSGSAKKHSRYKSSESSSGDSRKSSGSAKKHTRYKSSESSSGDSRKSSGSAKKHSRYKSSESSSGDSRKSSGSAKKHSRYKSSESSSGDSRKSSGSAKKQSRHARGKPSESRSGGAQGQRKRNQNRKVKR